jgi:hypothetical protein
LLDVVATYIAKNKPLVESRRKTMRSFISLAILCLAFLQGCKSTSNKDVNESSGLNNTVGTGSPVARISDPILSIACKVRNVTFLVEYFAKDKEGKVSYTPAPKEVYDEGTATWPIIKDSPGGKIAMTIDAVDLNGIKSLYTLNFSDTKLGEGKLENSATSGGEKIKFSACDYEGTIAPKGSSSSNSNCRPIGTELMCSNGETTKGCPPGEIRCK